MIDFATQIPDCDSHIHALLDLFISSDSSAYSTLAFPPLGNSDHAVVLVSIDFHVRDVPWEDIFKLGASAAASKFCEWVQVRIDVYIPHRKYQVRPHSPP